ncbi:hypothetical protein SAMN05216474_2178 [Lishizhenia tianjinensis]|uniref:DUF4064 domain-containing protein n=1 Tax=Lishizhenia tianjinensis TaxID=477690 RepID=A0A1I7AKI9_9FLAO|nr:hypothetical protein [Lishizhenia tianjinensis]SFT75438.1 hypothetical protein SAMN05216474_2178 [Lishizhenia tianjinensis]
MEPEIIEHYEEQKDRPPFLIVLLVLTALNLVSSLYNSVTGLLSEKPVVDREQTLGPEFEEARDEIATQEGGEEALEMLDGVLNHFFYLMTEGYYANLILQIITVLVGVLAVVLLFKMKKLGFHVYLIYTLLGVFGFYLIMPAAAVSGIIIFAFAVMGGIMALLYAINFKHLK